MDSPKFITEIDDFFSFNYSNFFTKAYLNSGSDRTSRINLDSLFDLFASPAVPLVSVFLYLVFSKPIINWILALTKNDNSNEAVKSESGAGLKGFIMFHNLILALYSGWTCYHSWKTSWNFINDHLETNKDASFSDGFWQLMCPGEKKDDLWVGKYNMMFWITHFYISKFYEFFDTWILLWGKKQPIFLQTFHHAGIAILMWMLTVTYSSPVIIVVCFNSFIHTIMYVYYALSTLEKNRFPKLRKSLEPYKPLVTSMQLIQFFVGLSFTVQTHFISNCLNSAQNFTLICMETYAGCLIVLFVLFYIKTYLTKKDRTKSDVKKAE